MLCEASGRYIERYKYAVNCLRSRACDSTPIRYNTLGSLWLASKLVRQERKHSR